MNVMRVVRELLKATIVLLKDLFELLVRVDRMLLIVERSIIIEQTLLYLWHYRNVIHETTSRLQQRAMERNSVTPFQQNCQLWITASQNTRVLFITIIY